MAHGLSFWRAVAGAGEPWWRRTLAIGMAAGVVVAHGCIADRVSERMLDFAVVDDMPARLEAVYVREMEPTAPVAVAPPRREPPVPSRRRASAPAKAASQVPEPVPEQVAAAEPAPQPREEAPAVEPAASEPTSPAMAEASAPSASDAAPAAAAASAPAFEWPASTRLSYVLTGNFRGEIHGTAQVEWIRRGNQYQVHLDVSVGLWPTLFARSMTSSGRLTPDGLAPQTYDQYTHGVAVKERRLSILFDRDAVLLPGGGRGERWPGVQDAASQFVQLSFLFTTRPELLVPGNSIEVPLALPSKVTRWVYDVTEVETLYTPFGHVEGVHLKPRFEAHKGGDLSAEMWIAPSLAYLPVRIRIHQDAQTYIDLMIKRKPQLAAP